MEEINGKVKIPGDYFLKMAKADYNNYRVALWREIYQNSIDAKATKIEVSWNNSDRSITVVDNGCGMNLEILTEKLLALGGSHKEEGSTGAFGKAKELELFSWERYILHTSNLLLRGSGDNYTITETEDTLDGCSITLFIQESEDFEYITQRAEYVAKMIETDCQILVSDILIECYYKRGEFRKSLDIGDIYVNENIESNGYAKIRMNGIWMFDQYVGEYSPAITVELSNNSIKCLNSNRDGLKGDYLQEASKYFQRLAADRRSALFPDKEEIILRAFGTEGRRYQLTDEDLEFLEQRYGGDIPKDEYMKNTANFIMTNCPELIKKLVNMRIKVISDGSEDSEKLKYFGFRWDTVHKFEKGDERRAKKFIDGSEQNAKRARTILEIWGETIKQVMLDVNWFYPFTIGFTWDKNAQAIMERKNNELHFFLNPEKLLSKYSLKNRKLFGKKIRQLATHEVAHIRADWHSEYFVETVENLTERTWQSDHIYEQIAKIKVG